MGGGGKSDSGSSAADQALNKQMEIADKLFTQTDPLREQLIGQAGDFLGSDIGITNELFSSPEFQSMKAVGDAQFARARDNAISNTPEGGGLTSALTNIDMAQALGETEAAGRIADANVNRAIQLATGGAALGTQGFGQAGSTAAQMAIAEANQNAGKAGGLGSAAGQAAGGYLGNK